MKVDAESEFEEILEETREVSERNNQESPSSFKEKVMQAAAAFAHDNGALDGMPMFKQKELYLFFKRGAEWGFQEAVEMLAGEKAKERASRQVGYCWSEIPRFWSEWLLEQRKGKK